MVLIITCNNTVTYTQCRADPINCGIDLVCPFPGEMAYKTSKSGLSVTFFMPVLAICNCYGSCVFMSLPIIRGGGIKFSGRLSVCLLSIVCPLTHSLHDTVFNYRGGISMNMAIFIM